MNKVIVIDAEVMSLAVELFWNAKAVANALNDVQTLDQLMDTVRQGLIADAVEGDPNFADDKVWAIAKSQILSVVVLQGAND